MNSLIVLKCKGCGKSQFLMPDNDSYDAVPCISCNSRIIISQAGQGQNHSSNQSQFSNNNNSSFGNNSAFQENKLKKDAEQSKGAFQKQMDAFSNHSQSNSQQYSQESGNYKQDFMASNSVFQPSSSNSSNRNNNQTSQQSAFSQN